MHEKAKRRLPLRIQRTHEDGKAKWEEYCTVLRREAKAYLMSDVFFAWAGECRILSPCASLFGRWLRGLSR